MQNWFFLIITQSAHVGGPEGWRQICSEKAYAETTEGKPVRVAELNVVLGLEDYGPIRAQQYIIGADKSQVRNIFCKYKYISWTRSDKNTSIMSTHPIFQRYVIKSTAPHLIS